MKRRLKIVVRGDGTILYIPQYRFCFIWFTEDDFDYYQTCRWFVKCSGYKNKSEALLNWKRWEDYYAAKKSEANARKIVDIKYQEVTE